MAGINLTLYKLEGYNPITKNYVNPVTGESAPLPKIPFIVSQNHPDGYEEFSSIEDWANYGDFVLDTHFGLRDYLALRYQIYSRIESICGSDYINWNNLSQKEKQIALKWSNIRIVNTRGIVFYVTECGGQEIASIYIENHLNKSYEVREDRYYNAFTLFGYQYLGKMQGLKAESYARKDFLDTTYVDRGVVYKSDDGIDGIGDWIQGLNGYSETGLKPRIISGEFVLGGGISVDTFCNTLVGILDEGLY